MSLNTNVLQPNIEKDFFVFNPPFYVQIFSLSYTATIVDIVNFFGGGKRVRN